MNEKNKKCVPSNEIDPKEIKRAINDIISRELHLEGEETNPFKPIKIQPQVSQI